MKSDMIELLIPWAPLATIVAFWLLVMRRVMKLNGERIIALKDAQERHTAVATRTAEALERVAAVLEKQPPTSERTPG